MSEALRNVVRLIISMGYQLSPDCLNLLREIDREEDLRQIALQVVDEAKQRQPRWNIIDRDLLQTVVNRRFCARPPGTAHQPKKREEKSQIDCPIFGNFDACLNRTDCPSERKVLCLNKTRPSRLNTTNISKPAILDPQIGPKDDDSPISHGFLIGGGYDPSKKCVVLKFYNPQTRRCFLRHDTSGHKPYCFIKETVPAARSKLADFNPAPEFSEEQKFVAIEDRFERFTKVVVDNPQLVSSKSGDSIHKRFGDNDTWERNIKYHQCFIYDKRLIPGIEYRVEGGRITRIVRSLPVEIETLLRQSADKVSEDVRERFLELGRVTNQPIPNISRVAIDIEVESLGKSAIPSPDKADRRIIATSFTDDKGEATVYVLDRDGVSTGSEEETRKKYANFDLPKKVTIRFTKDETVLIQAIFQKVKEYPCIITFNGDEFDLRYIFARSARLGMSPADTSGLVILKEGTDKRERVRYRVAYRDGLHIDLMRLFKSRALKVYAFEDKYREENLDAVATALLGKGKIEIDPTQIDTLPLYDLAFYCLNDAVLTMELTTYRTGFVMSLLFLLSRITRTFIEDMTRTQVSSWVRNLLDAEHRERNYIIPNQSDFNMKQVPASTTSIIHGKKYKGAIVETATGAFFDITPYDFSSMYPSIIKVRNVGYEAVRCNHPECRDNTVPETGHWTCTKRRGIISEIIGLYRDLRVYFYKPLTQSAKDPHEKHFIYTVSQALKVILNSSYGVLGFGNFQYYYLPAAEAVAAWGRQSISVARSKAMELNMTPVIIDTDSLYLTNADDERRKRLLEWCEAQTGIEMDPGSHFKYVVASGLKKNYFGVTDDGRVTVRGLTGKKRHTPPFIRHIFNDILTNVLAPVSTKEELTKAKGAIVQRLKDAVVQLHSRKIPLKELEFRVKLSRPLEEYKGVKENKSIPQHVKVAKMLQDQGELIEEGVIIRFVKTRDGAKPTKFATPADISVQKYVEFLHSILSQILDSLGMELRFDPDTMEVKVDSTNHKPLSDFV